MFRYSLTNKDKITCPSCKEAKKLSRYYDNKNDCYLSEIYGRCDREISCGYHFAPKKNAPLKVQGKVVEEKKKEYNIIPKEYLTKSLEHSGEDKLSKFLVKTFGIRAVGTLNKYFVGSSTYFDGDSTIFWQVASDGVRAGKIMQYTEEGKRKKVGKKSLTSWVHYVLYGKDKFNIEQVFFGNHLPHVGKTVVIVESEKTAIICDMFFKNSNYVFMASGMLRGLHKYKFEHLKGYKEIVLIPDFGKASTIWKEICIELGIHKVRVTTQFDKVEGMKEGDDLSDAILFKKITDKTWITKI